MSSELRIANLDFEYELAARGDYIMPKPVRKLCERWLHILELLPASESGIILWGVTPRTLAAARQAGKVSHFCDVDIVRKVNDKLYSHQLERELGIALTHSQAITSVDELQNTVTRCPHPWILKHPLGVSGRERMLGEAGAVSDSALGWSRRKIAQGWTLLFEPWVQKSRELSFHFEIDRGAQVTFLGLCELLTDASGVFRGNRVSPQTEVCETMLEATTAAAQRVAEEGYWGPVSLDSLEGRLGEQAVSRPLVEINARYTFGRLALELARLLPEGASYSWCHPKSSEAESDLPCLPASPEEVKSGAYRLPVWADPNGRSGSYLKVESRAFTSG